MKKMKSIRRFIDGVARANKCKLPTVRLLMEDRLIVEGKYCGNKLNDVPDQVLQAIVDKSNGNIFDKQRIQHYLLTLVSG